MSRPTGALNIRAMRREEVDLAIDWAAREGWNPGLRDAEPFYQADPSGFFVGEMNGEIVSTVSQVSYPGDLSFGGFFIVRPDMRGQRIGQAILDFFLDRGKDRNIGIDGVPDMVPTYEKSGFHFAYWNHRFKGLGGGPAVKDLVPVAELPFDDIVEYDRQVFSAPRPRFLSSFLAQEGTTALGVMRDGNLAGYGAIRPCRVGHKIGPLFADDLAAADQILRGLIATIPGEVFFLDVPEPNRDGMRLANGYQATKVFRTARLYTRAPPPTPLKKVFGVTSFELG